MTELRLVPFAPEEISAWVEEETERRYRWVQLPLFDDESLARERSAGVAKAAPGSGPTQVHAVMVGDERRGWVWVKPQEQAGGDFMVLDAETDVPAEDLLAALVTQAGDASVLAVDAMSGATTQRALAVAGQMHPRSTHMVLRLADTEVEDGVRLVPMPQDHFEEFSAFSLLDYARDLEESGGMTPEAALEESRRTFAELLPDGLSTPDQHLFQVQDAAGERVGMLWVGPRSRSAWFVYDIVLDEGARGRGLGRATMRAAAAWCRGRGGTVLGLNVFGKNARARGLYDSLGYEVVVEDLAMPLPVTDAGSA